MEQNAVPENTPDQNPESMSVPKKFKDLSADDRKRYQRDAKRRSRERQRLEQETNEIPLAADYSPPKEWERDLSKFSDETLRQVQAEIGPVTRMDKYIITGVAETSLGIEKNFLQKVQAPAGVLAGTWFIDAFGSEAVDYVHHNPALANSPTFRTLYEKLLLAVLSWSKQTNPGCVTKEFIANVEAELTRLDSQIGTET